MADLVTPRLRLRGLSKRFGGTQALDDVALDVLPGEIHGLLGENGSGKSTLIKILAGFHAPEAGEVRVDGEPVELPLRPGQFRELGMAFVHQDLALINSLSVVENLRIAEVAAPQRRWHLSWSAERRTAAEVFARYGVDIDPKVPVSSLSSVERAQLAIVRAVEGMAARPGGTSSGSGGGLLVLDEPTVFLPKAEAEILYKLIRDVVRTGASVLFVSHDLDEVLLVTDRVTVLRDGRLAGTVESAATGPDRLVEMIIGRQLEGTTPSRREVARKPTFLTLEGVTGRQLVGVSLTASEGEVVGLTGLAGSGFELLPYYVFGAEQPESGALRLAGGPSIALATMDPTAAVSHGIALIPGDRQRDGSVGSVSVAENVMLQALDRYRSRLGLRRRALRDDCARLIREFDVRPDKPALLYSLLSGGNQQKALLAKWLQNRPSLLLLHEPTQGVDIGARAKIFDVIRTVAQDGTTVLCASSDYEQLAAICDRVLIFGGGRIIRELHRAEVTKEQIAAACYAA